MIARTGWFGALGAASLAAVLAGCGGATSGAGMPGPGQAASAVSHSVVAQMVRGSQAFSEAPYQGASGSVVLQFKSARPRSTKPSGYVSPGTNGFAVTAYPAGATPPPSPTAVFDVSASSSLCTTSAKTGVRTCTLTFSAPAPSADIIFAGYDQPPSGSMPAGNLLSTATLTDVPISSSGTNTIPIAMGGVPATITLAPQTRFFVANGKKVSAHMTVLSQDADGYIIVGSEPFPAPVALSLSGDPNGTLGLSESQVTSPANAAFTLTYSGKVLVTGTISAQTGSLQSQATVNPLNYAPHSVTLAPGNSANVTLQVTNYDGPFSLTPLPTPAPGSSALPANCSAGSGPRTSNGTPVQISVTALTPGTCKVAIGTYARKMNPDIVVHVSGPTPTPTPPSGPTPTPTPPSGPTPTPTPPSGPTPTPSPTPPSGAGVRSAGGRQLPPKAPVPVNVARGPSSGQGSGSGGSGGKLPIPPSAKIQHIVVIVQENRSFNYLFAGFPGATTATSGQTHTGATLALGQVSLAYPGDIRHNHAQFSQAYDGGKMDGFDLESNCGVPCNGNGQPEGADFAYNYGLTPTGGSGSTAELAPYWTMAQKYALADQMFTSDSSDSYVSHQYLIAGQSDMVMFQPNAIPWGCDAPPGTVTYRINAKGHLVAGPFPCFNYQTIGDLMDAKGLDWRMYAPAFGANLGYVWSAFDAIGHIRFGPDWPEHVINPPAQILTDVANGNLAPLTYVIPDFNNSDHSGTKTATGPSWVSSIVNAVGASKFWSTTAILITWDEWGGWYDSVPPAQLDSMGLGIRVPLLVVSPYAVHGYVSHVPHEFGSILHFTEKTFGLPSLHQVDKRADDLSDMFDFSQSVTPLVKIKTPYGVPDVIDSGRRSTKAPDDE